jgi:N6-adenosine-specific RNA methylase IME4
MAVSVRIGEYAVHDYLQYLPDLSADEQADLQANIAMHGLREKIPVLSDGTLIGGRARLRACLALAAQGRDIQPRFTVVEPDDVALYVYAHDLMRRNLSPTQLAIARADLLPLIREKSSANLQTKGRRKGEAVAELCPDGKGKRGVYKAQALCAKAEGLRPLFRANKITLNAAGGVLAAVPQKQWQDAVARIAAGELPRRIAYEAIHERALENAQPFDALKGPYDIIYADPPWQYDDGAEDPSRDVNGKYATIPTDDICTMPVAGIAADDAALGLWITGPKFEEGLRVVHAWGFTYKAVIVWEKTNADGSPFMGTGRTVRNACEFLIVATRGNVLPPAKPPINIVHAQRMGHSAKPAIFRDLLQGMYPSFERRVELFARERPDGWTAWGSEIGSDHASNDEAAP